ncbi:hypothetical protein K493DRAFT_318613 [Basidiobolus meristosporus CBS 931.73]|uniref:RlpA-like protein double-psi beta-barrel domain-containing protein n=1 Tax=Basidiobolus meristosporus CBS 931.73 TaxID=1314790 RepID=A0A1Y1XW36_9FUNG|nr:hypothetical protein K493DRAFT_318613 [Basidiobolus meristosporus CBS 931.73]|eukprot:ORX89524.1 hypothetical protein K493DRAFT_318613 [Basidiobolus meristosporus CBS 931.73]
MFKSIITLSVCLFSAQAVLGAQFAGYAGVHDKAQVSKRDYRGDGTFFTPDRDACSKQGHTSSESDMIAALSRFQFGQGSGQDTDQASMCGKCVKVQGPKGSVVVRISDLCAPCRSGDIDLTPAAFKNIADLDAGRVKVTWKQVSC